MDKDISVVREAGPTYRKAISQHVDPRPVAGQLGFGRQHYGKGSSNYCRRG